ncbi:asparagine--tRNA ligase [Ureaplasma sp. ES3154-GEN]|uniref:asparagine--tRNA ligase n=1 Tax=Ureaplasma sp. ES3154-GEN TaxID=2984844 RepID=UPI0021E89E44|nr:asparagine--tRNA ligase [Ureaplasma sp. ES3154-GEN]MCV3743588.1 asparagine--tRNA ligase [Ureaplasma sp. ES3154-GEN]
MSIKIKSIFVNPAAYADQTITVTGWVKSNRVSKKLGFLVINDGSDFSNLQVVYKNNELVNFDEIKNARMWAAVRVQGELKLTPSKQQSFELVAQEIQLLKQSDEDFLMNNNDLNPETLRMNAHLRIRTNTFHAIMKIRSTLAYAIHKFMNQNDFSWVAAPLFTGNDAEGAGETFTLKPIDNEEFFGKPTFLTVTGQLQAEAYAQALSNVYTFGPTFRAEKSHTNRHLAEFWMIEPEMAFTDLKGMQNVVEKLIKFAISEVLVKNPKELSFLADKNDPDLIKRLRKVVESEFVRLDYKDAITILQEAVSKQWEFENKNIFFGMDLNSEHERYLCEQYVHGPVFLQNFPKAIKAFYMKQNDDNETVAATDLLIPAIGELVGGSQREADYTKLVQRCQELNLDTTSLQWYLDLRRFGYYMSAGFGIGFERLVMYVTGVDNIKDTIPFPRSHGQISF